MPDSTLLNLPAAAALTGDELLYGTQSGSDRKISVTQLSAAASVAIGATPARAPLRLVTMGDSNGVYALGFTRYIARLSGGKIRIVNNGCIAGETAAQIAMRWGRDGEPFQGDLYVHMIGTNDAGGTGAAWSNAVVPRHLELIRKARALKSNPLVLVCATVPAYQQIGPGAILRDNIAAMVSANFANDPKVVFIDTYTPLLDPTNPAVVPNSFFQDVHFNVRGVHKFAETVLANTSVIAALANVIAAPQPSGNDSTRQLIVNPNFDTGTETSGRAAGWSVQGSGQTFLTGTDPTIYGRYQRVSVPASNGFTEVDASFTASALPNYTGKRIWVSYKLRIVSRPSDVTPSFGFSTIFAAAKDGNSLLFGDSQNAVYGTLGQGISLSDTENGTWYTFYNEYVTDEDFSQTSNSAFKICSGSNSSANAALVFDLAEFNWGLIDLPGPLQPGISASYKDNGGSPGANTANTSSGRSAIAAAASSVVVTSNKVLATSVILVSLESGDGTATSIRVSAVAAGSFTVTANAAATAATIFRWAVVN